MPVNGSIPISIAIISMNPGIMLTNQVRIPVTNSTTVTTGPAGDIPTPPTTRKWPGISFAASGYRWR